MKTWVVILGVLFTSPIFAGLPGPAEAQAAYELLDDKSATTKAFLTPEERQQIWNDASSNPVAKLSMVSHYDKDGEIGFCFGRAMTTHLLGRKKSLDGAQVRKLFVIGDLRSGTDPEWRFHVTTLVKGEDGQYHALDPIMSGPLTMREWIATVQRIWDKPKKAYWYIADDDNILPDMTRFGETPADETGERIVELSFVPEGKPGFTATSEGEFTVYELDDAAEVQHFIRTDEQDRFDWLGLTMTIHKGPETKLHRYEYNGYFLDLLENLTNEAAHSDSGRLLGGQPLGARIPAARSGDGARAKHAGDLAHPLADLPRGGLLPKSGVRR